MGFHQRLTDGIVRTSVQTPEGSKYKRINQSEVRSTGLELLASRALGRTFLSGDLTLQRVRGYTSEGREVELEYEPSVAGKISADLPLLLNLTGTASTRFVGRQLCQNPEVGGQQSIDGSRYLDLGLRRAFGAEGGGLRRVEASVRLNNATDAVVLDQCGLPQPGRTLQLQLRVW